MEDAPGTCPPPHKEAGEVGYALRCLRQRLQCQVQRRLAELGGGLAGPGVAPWTCAHLASSPLPWGQRPGSLSRVMGPSCSPSVEQLWTFPGT